MKRTDLITANALNMLSCGLCEYLELVPYNGKYTYILHSPTSIWARESAIEVPIDGIASDLLWNLRWI